MSTLRCFAFALGIATAVGLASAGRADERAAVPPGPDLEKAQATVRELFKAEFAKTKTTDRIALAAKLFHQALDTKDDPAAKYVLLREARDLAAKAGDALGVLRAADETGLSFAL